MTQPASIPVIVSKYIAIWQETQISPTRACDLCHHGFGPQGDRACVHPEAGRHKNCTLHRQLGGFCGPEANHFTLQTA